jgi:hypothetical protein
MKTAFTTSRTQAVMVVRPSSLAAICVNGSLCLEDLLIELLEVHHAY